MITHTIVYVNRRPLNTLLTAQLIEGELKRDLKDPPVVEFEIPKNIFEQDGDSMLSSLAAAMYE